MSTLAKPGRMLRFKTMIDFARDTSRMGMPWSGLDLLLFAAGLAPRVGVADSSLDELAAVCYESMYDAFCEFQRRRRTQRGG